MGFCFCFRFRFCFFLSTKDERIFIMVSIVELESYMFKVLIEITDEELNP